MKNLITKLKNKKSTILASMTLMMIIMSSNSVFANDLINNPITNGLKKLLNDASIVISTISTLAVIVVIGVFQLKKMMCEDEMEGKRYEKLTKGAIFCYIIVLVSSAIIGIVSYYFRGTAV